MEKRIIYPEIHPNPNSQYKTHCYTQTNEAIIPAQKYQRSG